MRLSLAVVLVGITLRVALAGCPPGLTRYESIHHGYRYITCADASGRGPTLELDPDGIPTGAQIHLWPAAIGCARGEPRWDVVRVVRLTRLSMTDIVTDHVTLETVSDGGLAGGIDHGAVGAGELFVAELIPVMTYRAPTMWPTDNSQPEKITLYARRLLPAGDYAEANAMVAELRGGLVPTLRSWLTAHAGGVEP